MTQYSDKSRFKFHDIFKISNFLMKASLKPNPSKNQVISWFNSHLPSTVPKINTIEQLGNGVAYLHILNWLRPGSVRTQRINNSATVLYDIKNNLRMLVNALDKQQLGYNIDIDKLAQKKYQDNYHLAVFLYRLKSKQTNQNDSNVDTRQKQESSTFKVNVVLPKTPISINLKKIAPPPLEKTTFEKLKLESERTFEKIEPSYVKHQQKSQKLDKIASVLKLSQKDYREKEKVQSKRRSSQKQSYTMEQTYARFLRSSICKRSKYLKSQTPSLQISANSTNNITRNEQKISLNFLNSVPLSQGKQQDNELLLSDQKGEDLKEEQETTGLSGVQLAQVQNQRVVVDEKAGQA